MAKRRNRYESDALKKVEERRQQRLSSSVETKPTTAKDIGMRILGNKFGKDTFENDLRTMTEKVNDISGNWQTQETMANTRESVESMHKRINAYQSYQQRYGGEDLTDLSKGYKKLLRNWDDISEGYAGFENADAFNKARTKAQMDKKFSGLSYDDVQAELAKYDKDSDEYKYLSSYTNYGDLRDFDKALTGAKTNVEATRDIINPNKENKFNVIDKTKVTPSVANGSAIAVKPEEKDDKSDYIRNLETLRNQYALDNSFDLYKDYMEAEDFEEKSQYVPSKGKDDAWWQDTSDETYEFINNVDGARARILGNHDKYQANAPIYTPSPYIERGLDAMNEEEIAMYNYLYSQDKELANKFLDDMKVTLTKRTSDKNASEIKDAVDDSWLTSVGLSLASPIMNVGGGIYSGIDTMASTMKGEVSNPYSPYHNLVNTSATIEKEVGENIAEATEGFEIFGQNIPSFLYQTGMSIADTVVGANSLGSAYTTLMGLNSFQNTAKELTEAGASEEEILRGSTASGLFEMVFEKISLDNLMKVKNPDSLLKILKETAKQAGIEGSEEFFTETANVVFDNLNRGKNADTYKMYEEYLARGFSEEEAEKMVKQEINKQIGWAFVGGAISGTTLGGVSSTAQYHDLSQEGSRIRENDRVSEVMDLEGLTPEESDAYKLYSEYARKGITADNISDARIGNLYRTSERESYETLESKKTTTEQKADAINRLSKLANISTSKSTEEKAIQQRAESLNKGEVTEVTATGNSTKIEGIKIADGKTIVRTGEGEFDVDAMTFSNKDAKLISYAESMGEAKGNLMLSQYDGKADVSSFVNSFDLAYSYGEIGMGVDSVLKNKGVLTEVQASEIYKTAMTNKSNERQRVIDEINEKHSSAVFVQGNFDDSIIDYDGTVTDGSKVAWKSLTKTQRNAITFAKGFSKATGVNITFIQSEVKDGKRVGKNGSYNPETNTIEIDVYAGIVDAKTVKDSIIPTLSHEMTHWLKAKSPAMYDKIREHALETLAMSGNLSSEERVAIEMNRMKKAHSEMNVTEEMAIDEIVARYCEDMLANSNKTRKLLNQMSKKEQQSFIAKVKNTFNNLMEWVNELLSQYKSSSKEAEILREYKNRLKEVSKMWDKALEEAIKSNQSMQAEGITGEEAINSTLNEIGLEYDSETQTVYSMRSLEDAFDYNESAEQYLKAREEYVDALVKATGKTKAEANRYLDSLFLVHDMIANDTARLDYESAVGRSAWVSNAEYGGSIDFSTLCAKRRLFTGTMDAIHDALPDAVLNENDFLSIRNMLLEKELESPCSMCYVEGSRAKADMYIKQWLDEYNATNPVWKPRMRDFASATRLESTRINHPEAYKAYQEAMNKLSQRKPKEASVRTDYKGEILVAFADGASVKIKNENGGVRFNSFSDFEIIHALDCMQVITDMARVGLAGQGYTKVKEFAECFGNTGLKINLSLVAKGVDENGRLVFDEVNGMKYSDAVELRNKYPKNVGTVIVAFTNEQIKSALADSTIDYVLPFHRSQWKKSQYTMMGLPVGTKDYTNVQNDRIKNPKTGRAVKLSKIKAVTSYTNKVTGETYEIKDNIMPNMYWDYSKSGRENAQEYLNYINANKMTPKFQFLLERSGNEWVLPEGAVGDGYFKVLIDFKMYDNNGVGSPQMPVLPEFNMPYIQQMLDEYTGGHQSFPVAHDVVDEFVSGYKKKHSQEQYSDRDIDSQLSEISSEMQNLQSEMFELEKNEEFQNAKTNLAFAESFKEKAEARKALKEIKDRLGYNDLVERKAELDAKRIELIKQKEAQKEPFRARTLEDSDYTRLKKHFGTTSNFTVAGYMLKDGSMLDFSGKHWGDSSSTMRTVDHRDVKEVFEDTNNSGAEEMINMISNGNIRLMAETGGINLAVSPTSDQLKVLERYINNFRGEVVVDIDKIGGDTIKSFTYDRGTSAKKILDDIDNYFRGGRQSELMMFHTQYSDRVTDKDTLDFLNEQIENGEYATVYRSFQIIDGGLYAPMNAVDRDEDGKNKRLGYRSELGQWEMATESPEIAQRYIDSHPDAPYAKFDLDGVDNKTNAVAYNPYLHASNLVLNDQFSGAYRRNLVTVECRVPLSEIGAYRAKYAKDATGWADWKAGTVAGKLTKVKPELTRRLFLSRYMLPVRIVPDSEVAQMYKDYLDGTDISVPWNVVTPSLRQELEKQGVSVSYNEVKFGSKVVKFEDVFSTQFSDRDNVSVYDAMGETERLIDENARLKADIETLKANISSDEVGIKKFRSLADYLKKLAGSQYNRETLGDELKEVYTYIQTTDDLQWNNVFAKTYDVARRMMNLNPNVSTNYFKEVMSNVRKDKVTLSEDQRAEAEKLFGNYGDFHRAMFGRVNVVTEGTPLSEMWKEWSKKYPAIFDANLSAEKQVEALVDIVNALKASSSMMGEYEQEEAIRHLATEIYNQFWNIASDKSDAVQKAKANHRKMMEDLRKEYEQRQKEKTLHPVGETALKYEKLLRQTMQRDKAEVKKARELGKKRLDDYKDRAERNAKIQSITKKAMTLNQWLTKNPKDEYIPKVMRTPVAYLLDAIDFSSKQLLGMRGGSNAGMPTKKDLYFSKALEQVHNMVQDITSAQIGESEITEIYGTFADFPAGFADDIRTLSSEVNDVMRTVGDNAYVLNEMALEQLETLDKIVTIIKSTVSKMNKFLAIRHAEGVANLAQQSIVEMDQLGKIKTHEGWRGKIDKLVDWGNALPHFVFKRFGTGGQKVYEALQDGWDKFAFHVKAIIDYAESVYTSDEVKEWSKDIKTFDVLEPATEEAKASKDYKPKYQKVQMTVPQIMSLYCLQKREQAKGHLMGGGMRVSDIKVKNNVISQTEGVILAQSEIDTIVNSLTGRQKKVADALQKFMNTVCTDWGNEISMLRFGFEGFGEDNYFPIQSDKNNLAVNDETEQNNSLFRLLNMSFTKGTIQKANNRIVISDIFDVFAQHTSDMAKYNALALPVLDSFKWYNYKEKAQKGETQFVTKSLKQSMENAFGKDAQNYFTTFLRDINGEHSAGRDSVGGGFFTNAKIASVGFNMRVVALQPTSYLRASAVIDTKYLAKALAHKPKTSMAEKHCGIALWKSLGFYDINVQNGVADMIKHEETLKDRVVEASMKGAEVADKVTWGYLWNACELEVRDKRKDLKVGSENFYKAVGDRLREVIYSTQVVDSTMTRSHMMRSTDNKDKMVTAFMSEPTISYNMLQDVYYDWKLTERRTGSKQTTFAQNGKKMARVITAYTVTNMMCALVEAGFDVFRDDEDEMTAEEFMELYLKNFGSDMSILGKIPVAKEIVSMLQGYSSSRLDTQWMQYLTNTFKGVVKLTEGKGNAYTTAKNFMRTFSQATGLPFYNAYRDFMALLDEVDILTADEVEEIFNDTIGNIFPSLKSK